MTSVKILEIGPSDTKSRGGMATVINGIRNSRDLNARYQIDIFPSYIDGSFFLRLLYSSFAYVEFLFLYKKYDLFHIHTASYGSTFRKRIYLKKIKKAGKKAIVHIHGAKYLVFYNGLKEKDKKKVIKFLRSADMVIALSDDWKEKFEQTFGLTNCVSLPNGIDTDQFVDAICDPAQHQNSFVMLGRLGERKGAYDLVNAVEQAMKQNPKIKLYMAGDGEIDKVKTLIAEKKLENNIEVVGWVDFAGKVELLKKSATVVLPSYNEGLPMSILEGMAAGKAIISTTVGAIPEVVTAENGILIQPGDVGALADALVACASDPGRLAAMGEKNIQKINDNFSMKSMHEKLAHYFETV